MVTIQKALEQTPTLPSTYQKSHWGMHLGLRENLPKPQLKLIRRDHFSPYTKSSPRASSTALFQQVKKLRILYHLGLSLRVKDGYCSSSCHFHIPFRKEKEATRKKAKQNFPRNSQWASTYVSLARTMLWTASGHKADWTIRHVGFLQWNHSTGNEKEGRIDGK